MEHHGVFAKYPCWSGMVPAGMSTNFLGILAREAFNARGTPHSDAYFRETAYPRFDEEYFEWIDVLEAVERARESFTMIELGAGYGRWLVRAAVALKNTRGLPCRLIGVEAEPGHFAMMLDHFRDNGLDPDMHVLRQVAVDACDGTSNFVVGCSREWYGQSLVEGPDARPEDYPDCRTVRVPAVSLKTLVAGEERVDLIDLEVQDAEGLVLEAAAKELAEKVKRVHIGTHSVESEKRCKDLFSTLGWRILNDFSGSGKRQTPYGEILFQDGVQTWVNPKLAEH